MPLNIKNDVSEAHKPKTVRKRAAAKRKFDVYPSAYARLVREYKKRGGKYEQETHESHGLFKDKWAISARPCERKFQPAAAHLQEFKRNIRNAFQSGIENDRKDVRGG